MTAYSDERNDRFEDLGDLSAQGAGTGISLSCEPCRVSWYGCADASECPRCGSTKDYDEQTWFIWQAESGLRIGV